MIFILWPSIIFYVFLFISFKYELNKNKTTVIIKYSEIFFMIITIIILEYNNIQI